MSGEAPNYYTEQTVVARKPHVCCECYKDIQPGERYKQAHGVWEGRWQRFNWCQECNELKGRVLSAIENPDDCPAFGELLECAREMER